MPIANTNSSGWISASELSLLCCIAEEVYFSQLSSDSTCTCPNGSLSVTYECRVMGGFATIWTGSVISKLCEDSSGGILLLHSRFELDIRLNNSITCSKDTLVVKSVSIDNNTYTSHLTVTVSSDILGDTVICAHSHNGTTHVIGNGTIDSELQTCKLNSITNIKLYLLCYAKL